PFPALLLALPVQFPESAVAKDSARDARPLADVVVDRAPLPEPTRVLRRAARPSMDFDAVGERSFLSGVEDGALEAWVWPWQVFHDGRFAFRPEQTLEALPLARYASAIEVAPDATTLTYSSADARVDVRCVCPDDERAAFVWLAVDVDRPGVLSFAFHPRLQPQWPAAVGGVAGRYDARLGAFVLSEPSARVAALVGSPWATRATEGQQYLLPDGALRLELDVDPTRARRAWIPRAIVAADGEGAPAKAEELYVRVLRGARALAERHARTWIERAAAIPVVEVDPAVDEAFFWNAVSLRQGFVRSDALGDGLVAGYGPAGASSQRPGFAWFFSGDVGWNALAYLDAGLFEELRVGLEFARRHQRADGKIPHEVVLSAHLCDWFEKYPFAFIHGDTTGLWIHACRQFADHTGDPAWLASVWPAIVSASKWIRAQDGDGDGLPDNALAGMGASEVGALREELATDVHLASASAVALRDVAELARVLGDTAVVEDAQPAAQRALARLATGFWDAERGEYAHALLQNGALSKERTPWPGEAVAWRLVDGPRAVATMVKLGREDLTTPWGVRFLSSTSSAYDPKGYNAGAVWPFLTGIAALGDFAAGRGDAGWAKLRATARLTTSAALGRTPEVLSGSRERALDTSVPHQLFSSMAVVAPLVSGLLGWEPDALAHRVVLRPCFPAAWGDRRVGVRGLRFGNTSVDLWIERREGRYSVELVCDGPPPVVELRPRDGTAKDARVRSR
ncbi:MAG: hypothetical protein HZA53_13445, partial [Planctomycetes bacterium]|nr:hypothetical protein [Planctomycetota bacterium]